MGIYDRDYYRQGRSGFRLSAPRSAVGAIILLNVAVYLVELVGGSAVVDALSTHVRIEPPRNDTLLGREMRGLRDDQQQADGLQQDTLRHPWLWWQFVTAGFVHAPGSVDHILFNMLVLFFLGRDVEQWYGTREFIRLYLVTLVFSSVVWAVANHLFASFPIVILPNGQKLLWPIGYHLLGASGAIAGVVLLYALNFPKRILLVMFVLPMPAWLVGALAIAWDIWGAMGRADQHIAYAAHLGGAAFALAYFNFHWNFGQLYARAVALLRGRKRPSLKVFKAEEEPETHVADEDVDHILEKIHREGENSLTRKERRILENASREYQRRRRSE